MSSNREPTPLRQMMEGRIRAMDRNAQRCLRAAGIYLAWLLLSWLGARLDPGGGWTWQLSLVAAVAYGAVSLAVLFAIVRRAVRVVCKEHVRRSVARHPRRAFLLLLLSVGAGVLTAQLSPGGVTTVGVVGIGVGLSVLLLGVSFDDWRGARALRRRLPPGRDEVESHVPGRPPVAA